MDGGTNMDDYLGSGCGAQTRVAIESIQEFQVLTNQFDAEFGRTSGSIINAITKQGTNQFTGSAFLFDTRSAITSKNFFTSQAGAEKPDSTKIEWGATLGGPIVENRAHFFASVERVHRNDGRTNLFPTRPDLSWSGHVKTRAWNSIFRTDTQFNANNTGALRWVREYSPQVDMTTNRDTLETRQVEADWDHTIVGNYTSVIGNSKVNTLRAGFVYENFNRWSKNWLSTLDMRKLEPTYNFDSFQANEEPASGGWLGKTYSVENVFSWFVADKGGDHDLKFGGKYFYGLWWWHQRGNMNGVFSFDGDQDFDATDASTYPERLTIRVPGGQFISMHSNTLVGFVQDKWRVNPRFTVSAGVRYDLEIIPVDLSLSPLSAGATDYPVDKNDISPRVGFSYDAQGTGTSVVRGGYGRFYEKTHLTIVDEIIRQPKWSTSFNVNYPANRADPGPSNGEFPTDPMLVNGPIVNWALIDAEYPQGTIARNGGTVYFGDPDRESAYTDQVTIGYERQIGTQMSASLDYVHTEKRNDYIVVNYNPRQRENTSRTGKAVRVDAFGVLDDVFRSNVMVRENLGSSTYDGLNVMVERRMTDFWSARIAYALGHARGNYGGSSTSTNPMQVLDKLNLDDNNQPLTTDRKHNLNITGRMMLPGSVTLSGSMRYMSGLPFTIHNTAIDANKNALTPDPVAAGTYSGTGLAAITVDNKGGIGGARGPDFLQLDLRVGYRADINGRSLDLFFELFNATNRVNFNNPSGDQRITANFLRPTALRGGNGFPRQGQFGVRLGF